MTKFQPLSDEEIDAFFDDIDSDKNGTITFAELEAKLDAVHDELAPEPQRHHLHHPSRSPGHHKQRGSSHSFTGGDPEKHHHRSLASQNEQTRCDLHDFLCTLIPESAGPIDRAEFKRQVRLWNVPSQSQTSSEDQDKEDKEKEHRMSFRRRVRAYWAVQGAKVLWMTFVVSLILAMGIWQMVTYIKNDAARRALGWGIILSKATAGALYPSLFFVVLSMSRHFATFLRRFYYLSRFVNWDRSQSFHIQMSLLSLVLATLHAIGHLTGTFLYGSRPAQQDDLATLLGPEATPKRYRDFVASRPGWTGIVALGCFWIITLLSMPAVRRFSFEIFQLGHLLMFVMIAMLCAHGTAQLLQHPMLGYWLAFPTLVILSERLYRIARGFRPFLARMEVLDDDTVCITAKHPSGKWPYAAGQYILLQVPSVAFFQWHPFTISECRDELLTVHIKTDGDWTEALRDLPEGQDIKVGIDGPFGAPAQRFYDVDRSLIIGSGIGVTPFSAILTDLEQHHLAKRDPWELRNSRRRSFTNLSRTASRALSRRSSSLRASSDGGDAGLRRSISPSRTLTRASELLKARESRLGDKPLQTEPTTGSNASGTTADAGVVDAPPGSTGNKEEEEKVVAASATAVASSPSTPTAPRRVDFHWMVRDKNHLLWFSDLLNRAESLADPSHLDLRLHTHITARRNNISTHVFRYLLDGYRTPRSPYSALTGLKMRSHFGRPDLDSILDRYHEELRSQNVAPGSRVGVFFCGSPVIGRILADKTFELTQRGLSDGSRFRYEFRMEVFN